MTRTLPASHAATDVAGPLTLLVIDDSAIDRRIAGGIVERSTALRVIYAQDGREALAAIDREGPAAVLTDLQMPGMDGLELVEAIRERHPGLPVILMTAYGSEDVAIRALRAGATNYVPKKGLAQELAATLKGVLAIAESGRRRQRLLGTMLERESRFRLGNDPDLVAPLIALLQEDLGGVGIGDATARMRVGVALQEALANALYHGNLEVSSELRQDDERVFFALAERRRGLVPYRDRAIHVHARFTRGEASYVIRDEGPGFDVSSLDRPIDPEDMMRIGGRGLLLIRTFMDEVRHNASGNEITMIKRGKPEAAEVRSSRA